LVAVVTFNICIGNADAHGKNISFLYGQLGQLRLAPLYDTVPTAMWPNLPARAAMAVNGHVELVSLTIDDVVAEAARWPFPPAVARDVATKTVRALQGALDLVAVPDGLANFVRNRASAFTV
jgi:serine/threonine-protein kinase HipA